MTKEEFWGKIYITEEEKLKSEIYLKYRGIDAHENVRIFLQSLTGEEVAYSSIATAFRYDKRIRRIIFKYIGFLEEAIRAYLANKYAYDLTNLNCIIQVKQDLENKKSLFESVSKLTFGQLILQVKKLSDLDQTEIFSNYSDKLKNLKNDLSAVVNLRNAICHNRFILDYRQLAKCNTGDKNCSLWANIVNLYNLLPDYMRENFKKEIELADSEKDNKFEYQTKWNLLPQLVISIN